MRTESYSLRLIDKTSGSLYSCEQTIRDKDTVYHVMWSAGARHWGKVQLHVQQAHKALSESSDGMTCGL